MLQRFSVRPGPITALSVVRARRIARGSHGQSPLTYLGILTRPRVQFRDLAPIFEFRAPGGDDGSALVKAHAEGIFLELLLNVHNLALQIQIALITVQCLNGLQV